MFKQVTLKNFRTHKSTTIDLYPVTLLIGNNNSGKTNFLAGIQHFSNLIRRGIGGQTANSVNAITDLWPHYYRLAKDNEPMGLTVQWENSEGEVTYSIEVYENRKLQGYAGCREKFKIKFYSTNSTKEFSSGYDEATNILELRPRIESSGALLGKKKLYENLFL